MKTNTIQTVWELRRYDVWGNARDGYEVNDTFCINHAYEISCKVQTANAGTPQAFDHATPSDKQIRDAFGIARVRIEADGDDLVIYVNRSRDGYPIGEMRCTSHKSLSPIRQNS